MQTVIVSLSAISRNGQIICRYCGQPIAQGETAVRTIRSHKYCYKVLYSHQACEEMHRV